MMTATKPVSIASEHEEQQLLTRARAGRAEAFEVLVWPHLVALLLVVRRILRNYEDAEDVVQTALLNAWRNLGAFQGRSRFSSWLTRIAINAAFMRLRATRCTYEVSFEEMVLDEGPIWFHVVGASLNPEREVAAREILRLIESRLRHLKPHHVEILKLSVVQELTGKEVARILDLPITTVKSRLNRARGMLSRSIQPMLRLRLFSAKASSACDLVENARVRGTAP